MIPIQIKVYAAFSPVAQAAFAAVRLAGAGAVGQEEPWLLEEGDCLRISFEGLWFPHEEVLEALRAHLGPAARGKLDVLDLDAWTLIRHSLEADGLHSAERPLNHVLDYSGH